MQLGTKFVPARSGQVVGVRFYKGSTNVGTHTGSLWSSTGTRLAQVTFTGETASGWQTAYFTTPVPVTGWHDVRHLLHGTERQLLLDRWLLQRRLRQR